ncbi:hypothetical protein DMH17_01290 [Raoultella planticola]|nr:hypothetical protein [Raoultella planticola]
MRYEPLIGATAPAAARVMAKAASTAAANGYNIRGLESNRVGIMSTASRGRMRPGAATSAVPAWNTFGIGRDYIDPYGQHRYSIRVPPRLKPPTPLSAATSPSSRNHR